MLLSVSFADVKIVSFHSIKSSRVTFKEHSHWHSFFLPFETIESEPNG